MSHRVRWILTATLLGLGGGVVFSASFGVEKWQAPAEARQLRNPVPALPSTLAAAKAIYAQRCANCHGEKGNGQGPDAKLYSVKPTDFTDAQRMGAMADGEIFWKMTEGRRPMPGFRKRLTDKQRWGLVDYLRAFAKPPAGTIAPKNNWRK